MLIKLRDFSQLPRVCTNPEVHEWLALPGLELGLADALHGLSRPEEEWKPISSRPALRWNRLARLTIRADVWVRTLTGPKQFDTCQHSHLMTAELRYTRQFNPNIWDSTVQRTTIGHLSNMLSMWGREGNVAEIMQCYDIRLWEHIVFN